MQTFLHGRDFIGDLDFSKEEIETVLDVAFDLKRKRALNEPHAYLRDKVLAMLFFFSSTRTRGSFEAGMAQLAGTAPSSSPPPPRLPTETRPKKSARSTDAISTASPSVTAIGPSATNTSTRWPNTRACRCSTCSARCITPSSAWPI